MCYCTNFFILGAYYKKITEFGLSNKYGKERGQIFDFDILFFVHIYLSNSKLIALRVRYGCNGFEGII